jgi:hypothetical protein
MSTGRRLAENHTNYLHPSIVMAVSHDEYNPSTSLSTASTRPASLWISS